MTVDAIMVQLQHIDVRLDTLTTKMYQVNTRVGHITRRQAHLGGFVESPSSSPKASKDNDDSDDDDDKDGDATSSSVNEISA